MMTPEERARKQRERYNGYKAVGICVHCGCEWVEPGHVRCKACAEKNAAIQLASDPNGEKRRSRQAALRAQRRAEGLCIDCGKPTDGHVRCATCLEGRRDSWRKWHILRKMEQEANEARGQNR